MNTANTVVEALLTTLKESVEEAASVPQTVRREYGVDVPIPTLPPLMYDANYNFVRLFRYKAGQKFLFTIGRWCRAIGISRGELATQTLWYWIEDPTQMIIVEYSYHGVNYAEDHYCIFKNSIEKVLEKTALRTL